MVSPQPHMILLPWVESVVDRTRQTQDLDHNRSTEVDQATLPSGWYLSQLGLLIPFDAQPGKKKSLVRL
jgi:hypothetical protein